MLKKIDYSLIPLSGENQQLRGDALHPLFPQKTMKAKQLLSYTKMVEMENLYLDLQQIFLEQSFL